MSLARLLASLAFVAIAACNPQTPLGGDPDSMPTDGSVDVPDVEPPPPPPPPVEPPGRAVEVVNGAGRLSASVGTVTYPFDVVIGGAPRGRTGDGTKTLDAAPVLR
jgi:hypothetical protein